MIRLALLFLLAVAGYLLPLRGKASLDGLNSASSTAHPALMRGMMRPGLIPSSRSQSVATGRGILGVVSATVILILTGCASANMDCTDLRQGACKVHFTRFATDTGATLTGPDGFSLSYSSNPQAEATAQAFAAINRLAGLVAAGRAPVASPQPFAPGPDSDVDEPEERAAPRACPAVYRPRRVTAGTPWMIEGVAMAGEI
jgi:hypothetical protein